MRRRRVDSSSLAAVGYDDATATLEVEFHHGGVYRYFMVPRSAYEALIGAESIGRHFVERIRDRYRCQQID